MNTPKTEIRGMGITLKTALLSWLVTSATLLIFVLVLIPQQKRTFLENLESKARGVSVSLRDIAAGAAVNDDFSSVVDHCKEMLDGDRALDYLVVVRNDGFAIVNERTGWRTLEKIGGDWLPEKRAVRSGIGPVSVFDRRVFHFATPFDYSGIQWGWIHVGLSLESYDRSVVAVYQRTGILAIVCIALSFLASGHYAKRLVGPILDLRGVVQRVAGGDLAARAAITSTDEVGSLAGSVNSMTEALLRRDRILQSVRFAAQSFLSKSRWNDVMPEVLARLGEAAAVARIRVYVNQNDPDHGFVARELFKWEAPTHQGLPGSPANLDVALASPGIKSLLDRLRSGEAVAVHFSDLPPAQQQTFASNPFHSALLIPIHVEESWWGSLSLASSDPNREWTEAERDSLRAVTEMLGASITRQRTQDALLHAKEAAESASRAKSQFLANMSHEIRTPITGVMGMLELLQRTSLDEKQRRYVANTLASADALLTVIGDVLDFSKIEAGKLELETTAFSVADVLDVAGRLLAEKAEAKGLEVACRVAPDVPKRLRGDPDRLRQILINLLSNAIKFTEAGTVLIECANAGRTDSAVILRFAVKDTGCGIAPEQQSMIFEAFCQADGSMSRNYGGTGLGLTICRQLVQLMNGQIAVASTPGQGSTFSFTAHFEEPDPSTPLESADPSLAPVDFRGLKVLVVDDCEIVRDIVCEYIRTWKGVPEDAPEAATGLEKLRRAVAQGEPFSVAVLDWRMPGLDGFALARLIREDPSLRGMGLVLMSGFTRLDLLSECESVGFCASLPKPVRRSELYDAIISAANGRLRLPIAHPRLPQPPRPMPDGPQPSGTILLAEDNEINQEVACEMIAALRYRCVRVRNGREAVASVHNGQADLVLMDCQMPEVDGYEASRLIREWEQQKDAQGQARPRIPIIALTAHAMKGDRARCLEAGMDDYLTKPLDPDTLADVLAKWMPRPLATPSLSSPPTTDMPPPSTPSPDAVDLPSLLRRCMGKEELAWRLIRKLVTQAGLDLQEIVAARERGDAAALAATAHRLKGASANVSAERLREIAAELERIGRSGDPAPASPLIARLRDEFARLEQFTARAPATGNPSA